MNAAVPQRVQGYCRHFEEGDFVRVRLLGLGPLSEALAPRGGESRSAAVLADWGISELALAARKGPKQAKRGISLRIEDKTSSINSGMLRELLSENPGLVEFVELLKISIFSEHLGSSGIVGRVIEISARRLCSTCRGRSDPQPD